MKRGFFVNIHEVKLMSRVLQVNDWEPQRSAGRSETKNTPTPLGLGYPECVVPRVASDILNYL